MKKIQIEEGKDFIRIYINGVIFVNIHGMAYRAMEAFHDDDLLFRTLLMSDFPGDYAYMRMLIEQLREEGYFHGKP